ncbi:hypothetical protein K501DRAFT_308504 [Backusella circina FSU 941]|nr:hypothetical protein K501DRAFT_308504 [Backusella circina FSU 941]
MDILPNEIWNKIFIQLNLKQRLVCMLVCRSWCSLIDEYSLLYDIEIVDMINRSPHRAVQIEKKYINLTSTKYIDDELDWYDSDTINRFYSEVIISFIQLIGPTSAVMCISNLPHDTNVFKILDATDSRVKTFVFSKCENTPLLENFSRSNQFRHVKRFCFSRTRIDPLLLLRGMPELTSISLDKINEIDATVYLNALPVTVAILSISCHVLHCDARSARKSIVQGLVIHCNNLHGELGTLLSECFPRLVKLRLMYPLLNNMHIISFEDQPLQDATFIMKGHGSYGFVFKNLDQTHCYLCHVGTTSASWEDIEHLDQFTFTTYYKLKLDLSDQSRIRVLRAAG